MWDQYRKTFAKTQIVILLAAGSIYLGLGRMWFVTAVFFAMMQMGALAGAAWGARLKRRLQS